MLKALACYQNEGRRLWARAGGGLLEPGLRAHSDLGGGRDPAEVGIADPAHP